MEGGIGAHLDQPGGPQAAGQGAAVGQFRTPRSASRVRKPRRMRLASSWPGPISSGQLSGCSAGSASSTSRTPPGRRAPPWWPARRRARAGGRGRGGRGRVEGPAGGGSATTSCSTTSTFGATASPAHATLMSEARTCPAGPTRSERKVTTEVPPAPTSQQRQPGARPRPSRCRNVAGSNRVVKAVKRSIASGALIDNRYRPVRPAQCAGVMAPAGGGRRRCGGAAGPVAGGRSATA